MRYRGRGSPSCSAFTTSRMLHAPLSSRSHRRLQDVHLFNKWSMFLKMKMNDQTWVVHRPWLWGAHPKEQVPFHASSSLFYWIIHFEMCDKYCLSFWKNQTNQIDEWLFHGQCASMDVDLEPWGRPHWSPHRRCTSLMCFSHWRLWWQCHFVEISIIKVITFINKDKENH